MKYQARYRTKDGSWTYAPWSVDSLRGAKKVAEKWRETARKQGRRGYTIQVIVVEPEKRWGEVVVEMKEVQT